jgi:hypothetical protein
MDLLACLAVGRERLSAWSDLLDRINVFPVADGDTGRNLTISLLPLRRGEPGAGPRTDTAALVEELLLHARGNSGNIAARFLSGFLAESPTRAGLPAAARRGRELAWQAVADPRPGTMLSLFDALAAALEASGPGGPGSDELLGPILDRLEEAVRATRDQLPRLREAGVVDSGALGMLFFFDGMFHALAGRPGEGRPLAERLADGLRLRDGFADEHEAGFCVDAVLRAQDAAGLLERLAGLGESVVAIPQGDYVKVHLHTDDREVARARLGALGALVRFESDDMRAQVEDFVQPAAGLSSVHVLSDAAGSLTRADARRLGFSLLPSYVLVGPRAVPELYLAPDELYRAMRAGVAVSTSQASVRERQLSYQRALALHRHVLYITVGSVFTGNHQVALDWKARGDPEDRFLVLDSGSASGRLGLAVLSVAERAARGDGPAEVLAHARRAVERAEEFLFLDQLKFLARGGRLSKTSAFFGDLLHVKPVVSPRPTGAEKLAVLRRPDEQVRFARERLAALVAAQGVGRVMLEYTDNRDWVEAEVAPRLEADLPGCRLFLQPLSLTTGSHAGPGTWGVAFLADPGEPGA